MLNNIDDYRPDIDGLRAVAVLVVILFHAKIPFFSGGFVGVDIFFVVSGYLITNHLFKEISINKKINLLNFYSKRIRRLYPPIIVVIFFSSLYWHFAASGFYDETLKFFKSSWYSIFGLSNFFFLRNTNGYFDTISDEQPLLHFWSLGVEEQFYFFWPILLTIGFYLKRTFRNTFFISITLISFFLSVYLIKSGRQQVAFYMMPARAWEFALGAYLNFVGHSWKRQAQKHGEIILSISFILITLSVIFFNTDTPFPGISAIPVCLSTFFIILVFADGNKPLTGSWLTNRYVVKLGLLSYGIYLWHWPLLSFGFIYFEGLPSLLTRLSLVGLSLLLSYLTFVFIEQPFRYRILPKVSRSYIFIYFISVAAVFILLSNLYLKFEKSNMPLVNKMISEKSRFEKDCLNNLQNMGKELCTLKSISPTKLNLLVYGDSHANSIFPMVEKYLKSSMREYISSSLYSNSSVPPLFEVTNMHIESDMQNKHSLEVNRSVFNDIKTKLESNKDQEFVILISLRWMRYIGEGQIKIAGYHTYIDRESTSAGSLKVLEKSFSHTIELLSGLGISKILVVLPSPEFKESSVSSIRKKNYDYAESRQLIEEYRKDVVQLVNLGSKKYKNVRVFDPVKALCDQIECKQFQETPIGYIPIVSDTNHFTVKAAELLSIKATEELDWLTSLSLD